MKNDSYAARLERGFDVQPDGAQCRQISERDAALAASRYEADLCGQALADLKIMATERDALKADASRYRWLRDANNWSEGGICPIVASGEDTIYGEHLDKSIDAARGVQP